MENRIIEMKDSIVAIYGAMNGTIVPKIMTATHVPVLQKAEAIADKYKPQLIEPLNMEQLTPYAERFEAVESDLKAIKKLQKKFIKIVSAY